jgi:hypothetical protein
MSELAQFEHRKGQRARVCHSPFSASARFEALSACLESQSLQAFQRVLWAYNQQGDPFKKTKSLP